MSQNVRRRLGQVGFLQHTRTHSVVNVVIDISNFVRQTDDITLFRNGDLVRVAGDAVLNFICKVQTLAVVFDIINNSHALEVVLKTVGTNLIEDIFPRMTERRVPQIVPQSNSLRQILIQAESTGNRPCYLGDLKRVGKTCPVVISHGRKENLRFLLQPSERIAV